MMYPHTSCLITSSRLNIMSWKRNRTITDSQLSRTLTRDRSPSSAMFDLAVAAIIVVGNKSVLPTNIEEVASCDSVRGADDKFKA